MVPHKKNIPGVGRQQLKSIANRSLSGNLSVVSETDSELTSVAPTRGVEGGLPEKAKECPAGRGRPISLKGRGDVKCNDRGVVV